MNYQPYHYQIHRYLEFLIICVGISIVYFAIHHCRSNILKNLCTTMFHHLKKYLLPLMVCHPVTAGPSAPNNTVRAQDVYCYHNLHKELHQILFLSIVFRNRSALNDEAVRHKYAVIWVVEI